MLQQLPKLGLAAGSQLLFIANGGQLPVHGGLVRVLDRLGLVSRTGSVKKSGEAIAPLVPDGKALEFAVRFSEVADRWCDARKPLCQECVLVEECPFGKKVAHDWKVQQTRLAATRVREEARRVALEKKEAARRAARGRARREEGRGRREAPRAREGTLARADEKRTRRGRAQEAEDRSRTRSARPTRRRRSARIAKAKAAARRRPRPRRRRRREGQALAAMAPGRGSCSPRLRRGGASSSARRASRSRSARRTSPRTFRRAIAPRRRPSPRRAQGARAGRGPRAEFVLGADTIVALGRGLLLGKPTDRADARRCSSASPARATAVVTGVCALRAADGEDGERLRAHFVTMRAILPAEIEAYVASREWEGKAGGYAIQETADRFVTASRTGASTTSSGSPSASAPLELLRRPRPP
jgi:septum formation protein